MYEAVSVFNSESPRGVVVNVLHSDMVVSEFEFQSCYYVHFRTKALENLPAMDQTVSLLFFYKDGFGIIQPTKVDMLLSQETKANLFV